ncbi:MAG TPA: tetratricopeptide repeat protein, partial [Candidatus Edwardsbacteria bacterium]|nr:tetratricopeptide repeat protein [Candidatus Edwardsbacteria bacterium]
MSDYYTQLGVNRDASADEIAIAFRQLVRQRHQELGSEANLGELSRAYRTISSLERRREYDRNQQLLAGKFVQADPASPSAAESSYYAGLAAMEKQDYQLAVECFTKAADLAPEQSHFHSQLGLALGMFRDRLAEAEQYCKKAIELDADNPELYYNLGFLYQRHNLNDAAQEAFSQAQDALAARQVRLGFAAPATIEVPWQDGEQARVFSGLDGTGDAAGAADSPAGDLLKELESLESSFAQSEGLPAAGAAADQELAVTSTDDLLKELESIEAAVTLAENGATQSSSPEPAAAMPDDGPAVAVAQQSPAPAGDLLKELESIEAVVGPAAVEPESTAPSQLEAQVQAPPPEEAAIAAVEHLSTEVTADDLLKELEEIEAQVNEVAPVEAAPSETDAHVAEAFAAAAAPAAPARSQPDIFQETHAADESAAIAEQADQLLNQPEPEPLPLEQVQPATEPPQLEPLPAEAPAAQQAIQLETAAIEQPSDEQPAPPTAAATEPVAEPAPPVEPAMP